MTSTNFYLNLLNESSSRPAHETKADNTIQPSDSNTRVETLIAQLQAAHADITADYNDWLKTGFALASEYGESGRNYFHAISALNPGYRQYECDKKI